MWDIESISATQFNTALFDDEFKNISSGLQQASIKFIDGKYSSIYSDPFFWAPYIYLGK